MLHHYAGSSGQVDFLQVDISPRWHAVDDFNPLFRFLGGCAQFVRDYLVLIYMLLKKPDVLHLTTSGRFALLRDLLMCLMAKLFRVPVALHIRFGRVQDMANGNTLEWKLMAVVMKMAERVIVVSPSTAGTIHTVLPHARVEYIPNPVDCEKLALLTRASPGLERKTVLYLGWILPSKGIQELVQAWSETGSADWNLLLVGPGNREYRRKLEEQFQHANLAFLGEVPHDQAMQLMAGCGFFVLPSYTEGFPNTILEAMALGKAVLATAVGAIPEMLAGECGLLVPPGDVAALRKGLQTLIQDETLRSQCGIHGRQRVRQEYDLSAVFPRYIQLWKEMANERALSHQDSSIP
jgi:glycosyltransferase involved in cell wall biosynthesis